MSDGEPTRKPGGRAFTWRAVLIGLLMVVIVAAITPYNDWRLHNTFFYSQHLPIGVFLLIVLIAAGVNPLLGRRRFASGELMVIVGMLLILGGVVSSSLNRLFPAIIAGPAKIITTSSELDAYISKKGEQLLPRGPYIGLPEKGRPDGNDPEYRYVIDGFHSGLKADQASVGIHARVTWRGQDGVEHSATASNGPGAGTLDLTSPLGMAIQSQKAGTTVAGPDGPVEIIEITPPGVPWGVWGVALLHWLPLLVPAMVCFLAMAALVRRQWMHHERLPYPIANAITTYVEEPAPGSRFAPVFRSRWFWTGFALAATILLSQGFKSLGLLPLEIPTTIPLNDSFNTAPFNQGFAAGFYLNPRVYLSIVGIIFLIPADISFSVWFCFLAGNIIFAVLRMQGVTVTDNMPSKVSAAAFVIQALLIVWIGRTYYLRMLRVAICRDADPEIASVRPLVWAFLASAVGLVLGMVCYGAQIGDAIIAALCYLGSGLVLSRLVAEAGLPFVDIPMQWDLNAFIFSITGLNAPIAALIPLGMLGQTLCADAREGLMPFATNAEYLAEKAGVSRVSWGAIALVVLGIGTVVSGGAMLVCSYHFDGYQNLDSWWRVPLMTSLAPIASHASGAGDPLGGSTTYTCYGIGAVLTGGLGIARLMWSWWPLHPIGVLVIASYPTCTMWFSCMVAWMLKVVVMRYGGVQLYQRLKPAAFGLIAAEAVVAGGFLVVGLIYGLCGYGKLNGQPSFLPI